VTLQLVCVLGCFFLCRGKSHARCATHPDPEVRRELLEVTVTVSVSVSVSVYVYVCVCVYVCMCMSVSVSVARAA
jgi:hypothetical protein